MRFLKIPLILIGLFCTTGAGPMMVYQERVVSAPVVVEHPVVVWRPVYSVQWVPQVAPVVFVQPIVVPIAPVVTVEYVPTYHQPCFRPILPRLYNY